jgi:hypothetical protein
MSDDRRLITSPKCQFCPHRKSSHAKDGSRCYGKDCGCPGYVEKHVVIPESVG